MSFQASVSDLERDGQSTGVEDIRDLCQRKSWELNAQDNHPRFVVAIPSGTFDFQVDENLEGKDNNKAIKSYPNLKKKLYQGFLG